MLRRKQYSELVTGNEKKIGKSQQSITCHPRGQHPVM